MPKKKTHKEESTLEKVEKAIKKTAKKVVEEVKDLGEKVEEKVKEVVHELRGEDKEEKEKKIARLKEKAKKLEGAIKSKEVEIKTGKEEETAKETLVPIEDYLKSSIHLGTRAITPDMRHYVYKRRADSLAVFNTSLLDKKIKEGAEYLTRFAPQEVVVVCKRDAGMKAVELFSKTTGIRAFIKRYPAGILTNPNLESFIEIEMVLICDPWIDKGALDDAKRIKIPVMAVCDTNNYTKGVDKIIPGNNKSARSLGMIFYLLTKIYVEKRKLDVEIPKIQEFIDGWDTLQPPK